MKTEFSQLLFGGPEFTMSTMSEIKTRQTGPTGFGNCDEARVKTSVGSGKSKINTAAMAVDYLFSGKMNIASLPNMAYVEFQNSSGTLYQATCDGKKIHFNTDIPSNPNDLCVPLFAYSIYNSTKMSITRSAFETLKNEYITSSDNAQEEMYRVCDAFYYEFKYLVETSQLSKEIEHDNFLNISLIDQTARAGNIQKTDVLNGLVLPSMEVLDIVNKKKTKAENETQKTKFESCRIGEYLIDHVWSPERQAHIPDLSILDDFVPDSSFFTMTDLISHELNEVKKRMDDGIFDYRAIGENYVNAQFIGRPGTGKTTVANALAATFGLPIRVVINSKNTEEDSYQGMTKVQEGDFKFVETPFLDAYKNGGIILLEEINLTDPGVAMGVLGQAIEKPFILLEDGYKEVRRHPLCVIIGTANTGTQGSREPSEALTSRMPNVFLLDDPDKDTFIEILMKKNKNVSKKDCKRVYLAYTKTLDYLTSSSVNAEDVALSLCLRHCFAALKQMEIGTSYKDALVNTLIGAIGIKDLKLARETKKNVIDILAD